MKLFFLFFCLNFKILLHKYKKDFTFAAAFKISSVYLKG